MFTKKLRPILITFFILLCLGISLILLANFFLYQPSVQTYILKQLSENTKYNVQAQDIRLNLEKGIGFTARNITAGSQERTEQIKAAFLRVTIRLKELLRGRIAPSVVFLSEPKIELTLSRSTVSTDTLLNEILDRNIFTGLAGLHSATIKNGSLHIKGFPITFANLDFDIFPHEKNHHKVQVSMKANALTKTHQTTFLLEGISSTKYSPENGLFAEMTLKTGPFPLNWLNGADFLVFNQGLGQANLKIKTTSDKKLAAKGMITANEIGFSLHRHGRKKEYQYDRLSLNIASLYSLKVLDVSVLELRGPDFSVNGDLNVDFNNSDNPHIALNIESPYLALDIFKNTFPTPLVPAWIASELFPILSDGTARLENFSLNGTREQIRNLKLVENSHVISAKMGWKDICVFKDSHGLPFNEVSGRLIIEKGTLIASCDHAVLKNSTIKIASFHVPSLYEPPDYRLSIEGQFDLDDIKAQKKLDIVPQQARQYLEKFQHLSGMMEGRILLGFNHDWANLKIIDGDWQYKGCNFLHENLCLPVVVEKAMIRINEQGDNAFQGAGYWGKSEFQISGSTDRLLKIKSMAFQSRLHAEEIIDFFNIYPKICLKGKDFIKCEGTLRQKAENWLIQGDIALDGLKINSKLFSANISKKNNKALYYLEYSPEKVLTIHDLKLYLRGSDIKIDGSWGLKDTRKFDIGMSTKNLSLRDLGIQYKGNDISADGRVACHVRVTNLSQKSPNTSITGTFNAKDFSFALKSLPSSIKDGQCDFDFRGDQVQGSLQMRVGESPVGCSGHLYGRDRLRGKIDITSDFLNIADIIPKGVTDFKKDFNPVTFPEKPDLHLSLTAAKGKWHDWKFSPLTIRCHLLDGTLGIEDARVRTENGNVTLTGHVKSQKGSEKMAFSSLINLKRLPIQALHKSFENTKDIKGLLTLNASLSATGLDIKGLSSGLNGSADIILEKGRIKKRKGVLFKLLEVLNLQNIIKGRMPDVTTKGFYLDLFEILQCQIKSGTLESNSMVLKSPIFNAAAQGSVQLHKKTVDLNVWVQTLETMDSLIARVPIIGYILTEKENSPSGVLIYPYEVKGNWSDPEIKSTILKNIGPGVINIFKNILMTPGRIFKGISEMTTNRPKKNAPADETRSNSSKTEKPENDGF